MNNFFLLTFFYVHGIMKELTCWTAVHIFWREPFALVPVCNIDSPFEGESEKRYLSCLYNMDGMNEMERSGKH